MKVRPLIGRKKWFFGVLALALALTLVAGVAPAPAEAKYLDRTGTVMCYTQLDIPKEIRPYIQFLEYDVGNQRTPGARLYLTTLGAWAGTGIAAEKMARFVISQPEWKGDRSLRSVTWEIRGHCPAKTFPIHIEYRYNDLQSWEKLAWGR